MQKLDQLSDAELLKRTSALVLVEHRAVADVVEHLAEIDRRRLYLEHAYPSLYAFCVERFGYTDDAALKRIRVARLALEFPRVLVELRSGAIQLTGLLLLAPHLSQTNAEALLTEARWRKRRQLERLLAQWFPRPDVPPSVQLLGIAQPSGPTPSATRPGANDSAVRPKLEPLSAERYLVQFTASAQLYSKLERAKELLSHSVPSGELPLLVERALDALIERELKRRTGAGKPRKRLPLKPGSRHVPVHVEREVRERDGNQCTFTDAQADAVKSAAF
jgi:hypothetical protein